MKVGPSHMPPMHREMPAKAAKGLNTAQEMAASAAPVATAPAANTAATAATVPATTDAPAMDTVRKDGPPGLVKLAARFAAMDGEFKNAGQANAASRIQQNLERYRQNQGLATPPAAPPPAPVEPEAAAPTETVAGSETTTPASTPAAPATTTASDPAAASTPESAPAVPVAEIPVPPPAVPSDVTDPTALLESPQPETPSAA